MTKLLQDVRFAIRQLRKNPGFTLTAILTLALGVGANTAMFSVINSVLLRALPIHDPARVMFVSQRLATGTPNVFSTPDFLDWKEQGGILSQMAAVVPTSFNLSGKDEPERISGANVSAELFPTLGVQPMMGRTFTVEEDHSGAANVAVLSHALWKTRFQSLPNILGSSITLDGMPYTIIGVMPAGFNVFGNTELLWTPLRLQRTGPTGTPRNIHWLRGIIRLPAGASQSQIQTQLDTIAAPLHRDDATGDLGMGVTLQPLTLALTGNVRPALLLLMGCVGFVLLIACSNVANLLLARSAARAREISIRSAMGAMRARIVRQLLTESVLLALLGGFLGLGFAFLALKVMLAINPSSIPQVDEIRIDPVVLCFTLLICGAVGILFGIAPALDASRTNSNDGLREGSRGATSGFGRHRIVLIVSETALASLLLIGAGLTLKNLWLVSRIEPGFNPDNLLTFSIAAPPRYTGEQLPDFYRQIVERIQSLPGVQSAVLARDLPMTGTDPSMPITTDGKNPDPAQGQIVTRFRAIGPNYFHAFETPVIRGREFTDADSTSAPSVAIVSESIAKQYWPGENAIGKRLKPEVPGAPWCTVIGVVADVRHWALDVDIEPTVYYAYTQIPKTILPLIERRMGIAVRSSAASAGLLNAIRSSVSSIDKMVPVYQVKTMNGLLDDSGSLRRFNMSLLATFAGLALFLAAIGVYAVMAYSVSQRTREIGIRIAIGAQPRDVLRLIVLHGLKLAFAGIGAGIIAAFALTRVMASVLYAVSPKDAMTFSVVPTLILSVILLACYVPARRAASVDPIQALRTE